MHSSRGPHGEPYAVPLHKAQRRQRQVGQQAQLPSG